ncbi:GntR family transcriptional regulator [Catellatospora sp. TT07R-123]|uniref:GntR family transcriptional regulator n=1 Tax=Catellatospora sp. TT07R-123 TaxID=2733863 RepID=UPI001AFEC07E|nr:GntR family transcriptional regulator [Catellatospora sp. TT07R-123]GHJ49594.1 GntR family transcriptional regulator [Catellatospora sp. TT07R-123]
MSTAQELPPAPMHATRTLSDNVYRWLRDQIVLGKLGPNEPLVEAAIAEKLQVSRTPIRESMQRLAADGLIVSHRRRWIVRQHDRDEIVAIYEVRMALESFAARFACQRATDAELAAVAQLCGAWTEGTGGGDFVVFNDRFHSLIVDAAHNARLARTIEQNHLYYFNSQVAEHYAAQDVQASHDEHIALVASLRERDGDRAAEISRRHAEDALALILERMF